MNYNHMYRRKDRIRPKRTAEEKRNLGRIGKVFAGAVTAGILAGAVIILMLQVAIE